MTISNNPPAAILELTAGEAEALQLLLLKRRGDAQREFQHHQAAMLVAVNDAELCDQMLAKLRGESTAGRYQFKTTAEKLAALAAEQDVLKSEKGEPASGDQRPSDEG